MGNKICFHPRVILTQDIALHFRSSNLVRDVLPIIDKWRAEGADLCFGLKEFEQTFDVVVETERQFEAFDTDRNGRVDAHEVLMVYILLSTGDVQKKVDTVFSVFDFSGSRARAGSINFDEAMIMIEACVKGIQKVCETDFKIPDDEIFFHCKSLFDMHRVPHSGRISQKQFKEWTLADPSPRSFIYLFHNSQGLPDIYAQVQRVNLEQGRVFQMLAQGQLSVAPDALKASEDFRRALRDPTEREVEVLTELMLNGEPRVSNDRFHQVLRPWNIFNECDIDRSCTLDDKEMEVLLWIQLRQKPSADFVQHFTRAIDENDDGDVSRVEWVEAILNSQAGLPLRSRQRSGKGSKSTAGSGRASDRASASELEGARTRRITQQLRLARPDGYHGPAASADLDDAGRRQLVSAR